MAWSACRACDQSNLVRVAVHAADPNPRVLDTGGGGVVGLPHALLHGSIQQTAKTDIATVKRRVGGGERENKARLGRQAERGRGVATTGSAGVVRGFLIVDCAIDNQSAT